MGTYTIISLAIGFIIILFFGWMMYVHYTNDDLEHWVPPTLIVGVLKKCRKCKFFKQQ